MEIDAKKNGDLTPIDARIWDALLDAEHQKDAQIAEEIRQMKQNWNLAKTQMRALQIQINELLPNDKKLPPDWLDQVELIRDIVNPPQPSETQTQTGKINHEYKNP